MIDLSVFVIVLCFIIGFLTTMTFMIRLYHIQKRGYRVAGDMSVLVLIVALGIMGVGLSVYILYLLG